MINRPKALAVLLNMTTHDTFDAVLDALEQTVVIDLNDPATKNLVADAIRRLAPEGAYVPLHARYPWRFSKTATGGTSATLVDAVVAALRGSAEVHEAERLPHLVPALLALAEALERGALVPGPPPGPCPSQSPEISGSLLGPYRVPCELRATHLGLHEAAHAGGRMSWPDLVDVEGVS